MSRNATNDKATSAMSKGGFQTNARPKDRLEQLEESERTEKQAPKPVSMDKVSQLLGEKVYVTDWTVPWLYVLWSAGAFVQLRISRYYMTKKFALDMWRSKDADPKEVKMKRELCEKHGLKYFCLDRTAKLADFAAYLES